MLWHQRLRHIREKGIQSLQDKGMAEGLSNFNSDLNFYEHFLYGKKNRVKLPSGATRKKEILQLIHNDVFGFVPSPSLGGSLYYVIFIDDLSRDTWLYFLKNKSQFLRKFKEFKDLMENQIGKQIKMLIIDDGGEFCEKDFDQLYKQCGIEQQKEIPYMPQNGVAKRMNKSLMEKVMSMLNITGLE